jgi:hypothetical protein
MNRRSASFRLRSIRAIVLVAVLCSAVGVVAVIALMTGGGSERTALADAPSGDYAIVARPVGDAADELVAVPAANPASEIRIATVQRLPGYRPLARVSPDGSRLALVVPDGGIPSQPVASLLVVDLIEGSVSRVAGEVELLQRPAWTPDGASVLVTRRDAEGTVTVEQFDLEAGTSSVVFSLGDVFGIYPLGFDASGRLVSIVLGDGGSTLYLGAEPGQVIAPGFTRDWALNPDGTEIAFIEAVIDESRGLRYEPRVASLAGGAQAQVASDGQALGAAWQPAGAPDFGDEPAAGALAQSAAGFDVPLEYASGGALAVEHYNGDSFEQPGRRELQVVSDEERTTVDGAAAFFGWVTR